MRKRLTQIFPFLLPIRKKQKLFCFYTKMIFDSKTYSKEFSANYLKNKYYSTSSTLINENTGFDIIYQENKVFNLLLASESINTILIHPNETFSLWNLIRFADKVTPYKEGLTVVNGETIPAYGGGLCQLSNLLFYLFLHSPLTITERHGHRIKEFPEISNDALKGVDATIAEGWLDLKVCNDTNRTFQVGLSMEEGKIIAALYCDKEIEFDYEIQNENLRYYYANNQCIEEVDVVRITRDHKLKCVLSKEKLYTNKCIIGYELPSNLEIEGQKI